MFNQDGTASSGPAAAPPRRRTEYFAEETFKGTDLTRNVHIGWGVAGGITGVLVCMGMSAATQGRSWNVSFRWLQRRVGFQFGTMSYLITTSFLFYHNGDRWVTRDWDSVFDRYKKTKPLSDAATVPSA